MAMYLHDFLQSGEDGNMQPPQLDFVHQDFAGFVLTLQHMSIDKEGSNASTQPHLVGPTV